MHKKGHIVCRVLTISVRLLSFARGALSKQGEVADAY